MAFFHCFFGRSSNFQVCVKIRDRRFFIKIITVISYRLHQLTFLVFDYSLIRSFLHVATSLKSLKVLIPTYVLCLIFIKSICLKRRKTLRYHCHQWRKRVLILAK
ncbi:hypothetical protein HanHA300_Chr08g0293821 [Helianthus annuus]|nr:hypothetical protein HanHA300_Chr08g0293821 [Helianthus annuus]KAJ0554794.1 hypothetical protein HanHA89_Chr08g0312301 [Helianthus annuus]KAJ0720361.1 hypothetical protein HanLR1_Chr08g0292641 [Helianthus annuus]KAJ0723572.1 hypothetical protein HanOQP8_Chr08g0299951 [Helianthus annuus]